MSSLTSNLLMDPIEELQQVLSINSFGLAPSPATQILLENSFPITDEDKVTVAQEAVQKGVTDSRVKCRAKVGLLEGDILEVSLDSRGYTVGSVKSLANSADEQLESATSTTNRTYPVATYESLEAMLIGLSPAYVEAMTREITRRFEMEAGGGAVVEDTLVEPTEEETKAAQAGSEVWQK